MSKKETALATKASEEQLAAVTSNFPQETGFRAILLPRISFKSQDVMEGKGKSKKVVVEAGTFFTEHQIDEIDEETGKNAWEREEQGTKIEGIIVYQRKQLKYYDEATESFVSSPIYDNADDIVPLFKDGAEIAKGTPSELRNRPEFASTTRAGKPSSKLEETRVLYVLLDGELHQLNLRGTSMYSFLTYARKTQVPTVLTGFDSEPNEHGGIEWNKMTFEAKRMLDKDEIDLVIEKQAEIKDAIRQQKEFFSEQDSQQGVETQTMDDFEEED